MPSGPASWSRRSVNVPPTSTPATRRMRPRLGRSKSLRSFAGNSLAYKQSKPCPGGKVAGRGLVVAHPWRARRRSPAVPRRWRAQGVLGGRLLGERLLDAEVGLAKARVCHDCGHRPFVADDTLLDDVGPIGHGGSEV